MYSYKFRKKCKYCKGGNEKCVCKGKGYVYLDRPQHMIY